MMFGWFQAYQGRRGSAESVELKGIRFERTPVRLGRLLVKLAMSAIAPISDRTVHFKNRR